VHRIVALAVPDVVAFDLAVPAQVFGHRDERDRYSFTVCAESPGPVPTTTGFAIEATAGLDAVAGADTVIVPGFFPLDAPSEPVLVALREAPGRMVSVCTGAFALAAAGRLDGRAATTHWRDADDLAARYPLIDVRPDVLYVDEGTVLTSAGIAAAIDLCLHLYRTDHGADLAAQVARRMVVAPHRSGGQAQFVDRPIPGGDGLAETCAWVVERLAEPTTVDDMARHAGHAPRTFARRFRAETGLSPLRWLTAQRLLEARRLLEATALGVDEIARRCGLGTAANLRLHLAREAATTPSAYRTAFRRTTTPH
jgi:transcriptional regulator GlxA family with amidase domain